MENKRGQGLSTTTIILVAIGIVVLVILIWGFSAGWGNLWGKVTSYFGGGNNVDTIIQSCALACTTESEYDYCTLSRTVKLGEGKDSIKDATCQKLATATPKVVNVAECTALANADACTTKSCQLREDWVNPLTTDLSAAAKAQDLVGKGDACQKTPKEEDCTQDYCEWK